MMLLLIVYKSWKCRNRRYGKLFLTGILFNIGCLLVIAPQYSMYLWVYMFMAIGYIHNTRVFCSHRVLVRKSDIDRFEDGTIIKCRVFHSKY